ncbi:MAG: IS1595 family transposase [Deltaproteobacteria bacterium]|jgi:transposase-like protein|nr:IS1595 family transposase [Deltaproteobacteria bacterium]
MREQKFTEFLAQLKELTEVQRTELRERLGKKQHKKSPALIVNEKFASKPVCPNCQSNSVHKWGVVSDIQRYRCKQCGRSFNALSGTPMSRLRKKELWLEYSKALADSMSLSKTAERCGIDRTTAFRWRHRFLQTPSHNRAFCSGITEVDETYFRESFKGKKLFHREPRKRGKDASVRGLSAEQIPVVVARDREGHTCDAVLRSRTAKEVGIHIGSQISPASVLCIEQSRILIKFAKDNGLAFETIGTKQRRGREKVFHVQNVNAYHSRLKNWIARFHGVATERLPSYLGWRRLHELALRSPEDWLREVMK